MTSMTRFLMTAAMFCGATYGAEAADLSQPPPVINYPAPVAADPGPTGWYLRGDVGVGIVNSSSWYESSIDSPSAGVTTGWINKSVNDTAFVDAGVGYQFTDNLRGDVTLQYRTATSFQGGNYIKNNTTQAVGENSITGATSSVIGLVNGYYDITHWNGLTPYVGAGIGFAYNQMHATSTQQGGFSPNEYGVYPTGGQTNLAWALHTGLSYDINSRLKLEMGYSFLNYGDTKAGPLTCYGSSTPVACNDIFKIHSLTSSDFHLGMRWLLDGQASGSSSYQSNFQSNWQQPTTFRQSSTSYQSSSAPVYQGGQTPVVARY